MKTFDELTVPSDKLEENVRRFFTILDTKEISDNDVEFNPVKLEVFISSVRVMKTAELNKLLNAMREQSGYVKD